ncbi:hypothetical protein [Mucilaginibacter lappiensis]|uniref:Lipocalin-like domain-containing protein n=1 Tax=Mucilaginibacter lappiensis TaxID=354630 RepID=A0A1N7FTL3_9SPHI|nr:hypothetical protein [Mucilaginibacter lappiensis]MBB6112599.1 hypothetical protein [Mucilaginibacter lappiensis]MBB6129164.1 hypothetical protein [Mucilaginibacter lappiensis]SIS03597.1 hypothetical protein SAMN05421821_119134 [Mucilaginibacter lappiensis]
MKPLAIIGFIAVIIISLSFKRQTDYQQRSSLYGKWKLSEIFNDPGNGNGKWNKVVDTSYNIQFYKNGQIDGNYDFKNATYKIKDSITLAIKHADKTIQEYHFKIQDQTLIMSPSKPILCDEPCAMKYIKME